MTVSSGRKTAAGIGRAHSGSDGRGRLYSWNNGGWTPLAMPDESMPYALSATNGRLVAGLADGRLLISTDRGQSWEDTGIRTGSLLAMTVP